MSVAEQGKKQPFLQGCRLTTRKYALKACTLQTVFKSEAFKLCMLGILHLQLTNSPSIAESPLRSPKSAVFAADLAAFPTQHASALVHWGAPTPDNSDDLPGSSTVVPALCWWDIYSRLLNGSADSVSRL